MSRTVLFDDFILVERGEFQSPIPNSEGRGDFQSPRLHNTHFIPITESKTQDFKTQDFETQDTVTIVCPKAVVPAKRDTKARDTKERTVNTKMKNMYQDAVQTDEYDDNVITFNPINTL